MMIEEVKISVVEDGTILKDTHGICPKCSYNFKGEDVRDYFERAYREHNPDLSATEIKRRAAKTAVQYGWSKKNPVSFSNIIGIEIPGGYDGVMFHQCPKCNTTWNRFTGKEVVITTTQSEPNEELLNGTDNQANERE